MEKFTLREISSKNIIKELETIGFDNSYLEQISDKFKYRNIKIYDLTPAQANIIKQTALSFGADCAVNKNVITGDIPKSDAILCGSFSQLRKISSKLKTQPFKLAILGEEILQSLNSPQKKTQLVGILNITPNSFSDGGLYFKQEDAYKKITELIEDGADIIDIGAESTRPFSEEVSSEEQIKRLRPILDFIQKEKFDTKISVDTRSSKVADYALNNGAVIINDVSGFDFDPDMALTVAKYNASVVIQHSTGKSEEILKYKNITEEVFQSLKTKIIKAKEAGIDDIIVDPGIGFGKDSSDCIELLDNISSFYSLGCPIMAGISRKSFLGIESENNEQKDALTLAYSYPLIKSGIDYLRVHNVKLHKLLLNSIPD